MLISGEGAKVAMVNFCVAGKGGQINSARIMMPVMHVAYFLAVPVMEWLSAFRSGSERMWRMCFQV